jgi:hypothetical protein
VRGGPSTRGVRQVMQTGPHVELADQLGYEPHRRGGRTISSARTSAGGDLVALARSDCGHLELVTPGVDHPRGGAGEAEGRRPLPSAIPLAGLVLAAALAQLAQCEAAHRAESSRA